MGNVSVNAYSSQSISGYNASPPPDDGSEVSANKLEWNKGKTKLADPIKTLSESINSAVSTAHSKGINTDAAVANQISGSLALEWATATIADNAITPNASAVFVGTEAGATSDTLQTIIESDTFDGAILRIRARNASEEVIVVHATSTAATESAANIFNNGKGDITLNDTEQVLEYQRDDNVASGWVQLGPVTADQAAMEAETTGKVVTADVARHAPSAAKLWGSVDRSAGTPTLNVPDYNITSVSDDGAGQTIVTVDDNFTDVDIVAGANTVTSSSHHAVVHTLAITSFKVKTLTTDTTAAVDTIDFTCWVYGEQ